MMLCIALDSDIEIRSLELADAPAVESLREGFTSHGDEWLYRGSAQEFIESALSDDSESNSLNIGIFELGQLAGVVICTIDAEQKSVRFDYMLGNRYRGRGLATRAVMGLLEHFLTACGFLEASILVDPENHKSVAIPERLGFDDAGTIRDGVKYKTGSGHVRTYKLSVSNK